MEYLNSNLMRDGGPMMWVLLLVSLFGFIIFTERTLYLHRGQIRTTQFLDGILNLLRKGRRLEALTLCEDIPGPIPNLVKAILLHAGATTAILRQQAEEAAMVEIPILERRIGALLAIARIAPLLGLAGTILGMIRSFLSAASANATSYPSFGLMLGGLGQALFTTAYGLLIAVMAYVAHHFLHGRVKALVHDMEYTAHHLIRELAGDSSSAAGPNPDLPSPPLPTVAKLD